MNALRYVTPCIFITWCLIMHIGNFASFLGMFAKLRKASISFVLSVCTSAWNNSAATGQIFMKLDTSLFFENLLRKYKFHKNWTRIMGTLHEDRYTFVIIPQSFLLRMRNVSNKNFRENQNTHFMFNICFTKIMPFMRWCGKILYSWAGHGWQYSAYTLHAGQLRLQINTHNM